MTATPRIFADIAKAKAEQDSVALCSMDDPALYGEALYVLTFSEAVRQLLVDYKVVVLASGGVPRQPPSSATAGRRQQPAQGR
jgi:predicted helicase